MADVPIIDFLPFREGSPAAKMKIAHEVRDACEGSGFFYLARHGVPSAAVEAVFVASRRFFTLPLEERMKVKLSPKQNRGYQPLGSRHYAEQADAPDLNESFKYQHELSADDPDIRDGNRVHAPNRWPAGLPGWRETLIGY